MGLTPKELRARDPERYRSYTAKYRETHREKELARSRAKYTLMKADPEYKKKRLDQRARHFRKLRLELETLLGSVCCRCGFSDRRALQIDHIAGDGAVERKKPVGQGFSALNRMLFDPDVKLKYQLLCANCNWIKRCENRECVQRELEDVN